jgi:hypothetical protein
MIDILKLKPKDGWELFFDAFVAHFRDRKTPNLQAFWKHLVTNFDAGELLGRSVAILQPSNTELCWNTVDVIREIVLSMRGPEDLRLSMPVVTEALRGLLNHESVDVRKSSIFCYVAIASVFGSEGNEYVEQLPQKHQKLVSLYLQK